MKIKLYGILVIGILSFQLCFSMQEEKESDDESQFLKAEIIRYWDPRPLTLHPTIRIASICIMNDRNEMLFGKENNNEWSCPIAILHQKPHRNNSNLKICAKESMQEELGITIDKLRSRAVMPNNLKKQIDGKDEIIPITVIMYRAHSFFGTPTLLNQERFLDLAWFSKDQIQHESFLKESAMYKQAVLREFDR